MLPPLANEAKPLVPAKPLNALGVAAAFDVVEGDGDALVPNAEVVTVYEAPRGDGAPNAGFEDDAAAPNADGEPNVGLVLPAGLVDVDIDVGEGNADVGLPNALAVAGLGFKNGDDALIAAPPNAPKPPSNLPNPVGCAVSPAKAPPVGAAALLVKADDVDGAAFSGLGVEGAVMKAGVPNADVGFFSGVEGAGVVVAVSVVGADVGGLLPITSSFTGGGGSAADGLGVSVAAAAGFGSASVDLARDAKLVGPALANAAKPPVEVLLLAPVLNADLAAAAGVPNAD